MKAPLPLDEDARLKILAEFAVMDSEVEGAYDDITELAAQICGCPIALVTLLDEDRQWFKSVVGLAVRETPREHAFCAHAILKPAEVLLVNDARVDTRFSDNPLVTGEPGIRFYAGVPLCTQEGVALGTLCVIDRVPRTFLVNQTSALRTLARQISALLELRRAGRKLAQALTTVRSLEGLLPICANCKSIRDKADKWTSIEAFLDARSAVSMTHTICPACFPKLYPGFKYPD